MVGGQWTVIGSGGRGKDSFWGGQVDILQCLIEARRCKTIHFVLWQSCVELDLDCFAPDLAIERQ